MGGRIGPSIQSSDLSVVDGCLKNEVAGLSGTINSR
jgi:hypothetical protein